MLTAEAKHRYNTTRRERYAADQEYRDSRREASRQSRVRHIERARLSERWTERDRVRQRERYATDPEYRERVKRRARDRRQRVGPLVREAEFRANYGIGYAERDALLEQQGGVCAVCGTDDPGRGKAWNLDHEHASGKIRGVLCVRCNFMIGHAKDNPDILTAGAAYLRREHCG